MYNVHHLIVYLPITEADFHIASDKVLTEVEPWLTSVNNSLERKILLTKLAQACLALLNQGKGDFQISKCFLLQHNDPIQVIFGEGISFSQFKEAAIGDQVVPEEEDEETAKRVFKLLKNELRAKVIEQTGSGFVPHLHVLLEQRCDSNCKHDSNDKWERNCNARWMFRNLPNGRRSSSTPCTTTSPISDSSTDTKFQQLENAFGRFINALCNTFAQVVTKHANYRSHFDTPDAAENSTVGESSNSGQRRIEPIDIDGSETRSGRDVAVCRIFHQFGQQPVDHHRECFLQVSNIGRMGRCKIMTRKMY